MPAETEFFTKFKNVKSTDFRSVYSNNASFQVGIFDFNMFFGEVTGLDQENQTVTVEQRVKVIMSLLHAKIFVLTATQQLRAFEKQWGEIKIPEGILAASGNVIDPILPTAETAKKQ